MWLKAVSDEVPRLENWFWSTKGLLSWSKVLGEDLAGSLLQVKNACFMAGAYSSALHWVMKHWNKFWKQTIGQLRLRLNGHGGGRRLTWSPSGFSQIHSSIAQRDVAMCSARHRLAQSST